MIQKNKLKGLIPIGSKKIYGNVVFYNPQMEFMFKNSIGKANFYLNKGLAEIISIDEHGDPKEIRLTFEPRGQAHKDKEDVFYSSDKHDRCVVTGVQENLTHHHIVPNMFRKHLPLELKEHVYHDIVLLNAQVHAAYERESNELKDLIARELGIPTHYEYSKQYQAFCGTIKMAQIILKFTAQDNIYKVVAMMDKFETITNIKPYEENLRTYIRDCRKLIKKEDQEYGALLMSKIRDYQQFIVRWRQHFLDHTKPQFMPDGWDVNKIDKSSI